MYAEQPHGSCFKSTFFVYSTIWVKEPYSFILEGTGSRVSNLSKRGSCRLRYCKPHLISKMLWPPSVSGGTDWDGLRREQFRGASSLLASLAGLWAVPCALFFPCLFDLSYPYTAMALSMTILNLLVGYTAIPLTTANHLTMICLYSVACALTSSSGGWRYVFQTSVNVCCNSQMFS